VIKNRRRRVFDFRSNRSQMPDLKALFKRDRRQPESHHKIEKITRIAVEVGRRHSRATAAMKSRAANASTLYSTDGRYGRCEKAGKPLSAENRRRKTRKERNGSRLLQKREIKKEATRKRPRRKGKTNEKDEPGLEIFCAHAVDERRAANDPRPGRCCLAIWSRIRNSDRTSW